LGVEEWGVEDPSSSSIGGGGGAGPPFLNGTRLLVLIRREPAAREHTQKLCATCT
jgi:hypothetical protein